MTLYKDISYTVGEEPSLALNDHDVHAVDYSELQTCCHDLVGTQWLNI